MTSYESMTAKLRATGLYRLTNGGAVSLELQAYAQELDRLFGEIDEMLREAFIPTAETYGITERERMIGRERDDLSLARRRELLLRRESRTVGSSSPQDLNDVIEACGVTDYDVDFTPRLCQIDVTVRDALDDFQKAALEANVNAFAPITHVVNYYYES